MASYGFMSFRCRGTRPWLRMTRQDLRRLRSAICSKVRRASLTDALSGNARDKSGSIRTMLEPSAILAAYFPRSRPAGKSSRRYSGRRSSSWSWSSAMFVESSFRSSRKPGADDADPPVPLAVRDGQQSTNGGGTERDPPSLAGRVVRIGTRGSERKEIAENQYVTRPNRDRRRSGSGPTCATGTGPLTERSHKCAMGDLTLLLYGHRPSP